MNSISKSLAEMITEYVEGGIRGGTEWRNGLENIIERRLHRFLPKVVGEPVAKQWRCVERGEPRTAWRTSTAGDEDPVWKDDARQSNGDVTIEYRDLFAVTPYLDKVVTVEWKELHTAESELSQAREELASLSSDRSGSGDAVRVKECEGADDPEERCPRHPRDCTCWQIDLNHPTRSALTIDSDRPDNGKEASHPPAQKEELIRDLVKALESSKELATVAEGMTSCQADDDFVWGIQAKINAALTRAAEAGYGGGDE